MNVVMRRYVLDHILFVYVRKVQIYIMCMIERFEVFLL
jgi:hypothetical protein